MRNGFHAALATVALLLIGPAMAKPVHPAHTIKAHAKSHRMSADRRYAQSFYNYRSSSLVREEFIDMPRRPAHHVSRYEERRDSHVVENLSGDFTGGVGYGANGDAFVDGYGQTHFFVGSFRGMNPLPHGPYTPNRFGPRGRAF
jgi:hypothetical protein